MKISVKNTIYQAIVQNKWLDIVYEGKKGSTHYYIGVKDIDLEKRTIDCDIFNPFKSNEVISEGGTYIYLDKIKTALILEHSYYESPEKLVKKINENKNFYEFLEVANFDNNILLYLSDCHRLDNDPFLKEVVMVDGLDLETLNTKGGYKLDDAQFDLLLRKIFKKNEREAESINRYQTLAINRFSIDINGKQYVVAYRVLSLNFKDRTIHVSKKSQINKSFLVEEGKRVVLGNYLDMDPAVFCKDFDDNQREFIDQIESNFRRGEKVNTRPNIFFLSRNSMMGVEQAIESIYKADSSNGLSFPLKAFFGRNKAKSGTSKEVDIVCYDKTKINIDQMRVVYNSMVNHITYVKGPPGTGKTETIFNVLLSAYSNGKTVLVCSNNNHPVDDIYKKMNGLLDIKQKSGMALFPIIRIGSNAEMVNTLARLREVVAFASENANKKTSEKLTDKSKVMMNTNFHELRNGLADYESSLELKERIEILNRINDINSIPKMNEMINEQINTQQRKLAAIKCMNDEDIAKYARSAKEDVNFQNFLYFSTLARFKRLLGNAYEPLIEIIEMPDEKAVTALNEYLRNDANLHRFLQVFPIVVCTNQSCDKLGSPKPQFDLCIMDEAGQCNIATSLVPMVRASDLLLVGDTNQLQPVTVIEEELNWDLRRKYSISDDYDYVHNSILSTMLRKDSNSKSILLRYHYRCGAKIANFVNHRFYDGQLKLKNERPGQLIYVDVKNRPNPNNRNSYLEEAHAIAELIKKNQYHDVGIITPFVNQAALINSCLAEQGITDVKAGTIHTLQGSEKSTIIFSAALSTRTGKKTMDWIKDNHELINVGVTRAKEALIFVGDKQAIDALSGNEKSDIKVLSDYVFNDSDFYIPKSETVIMSDFSNNSQNEKEFYATIQPYFNRRNSKFRIKRNVPVKDVIGELGASNTLEAGVKEFDVVIEATSGMLRRYKPIVVFEIDGGEHVGSKKIASRDRAKEKICNDYGIKLIRIANSQVKDYEMIVSSFESCIKGISDLDDVLVQGSLFEG